MLEAKVVTKWLEPYVVLETFKKYYKCLDLTFDGSSKSDKKTELYNFIESYEGFSFGLYLKNVNKFYFMSSKEIKKVINDILTEDLGLTKSDIMPMKEVENAVSLIDMAKAEIAIFIKS